MSLEMSVGGSAAARALGVSKCYGERLMFRVVGKVQGNNLSEGWYSGVFLGKRPGSEENLVMKEDGAVVRARAIREVAREMRLENYDVLKGTPHDPAGTLRGFPRDEARPDELREGDVERIPMVAPKCADYETGSG